MLFKSTRGLNGVQKWLYFAAAGFSVAWWVCYVGILRFGPARSVEVYGPLGKWWRM